MKNNPAISLISNLIPFPLQSLMSRSLSNNELFYPFHVSRDRESCRLCPPTSNLTLWTHIPDMSWSSDIEKKALDKEVECQSPNFYTMLGSKFSEPAFTPSFLMCRKRCMPKKFLHQENYTLPNRISFRTLDLFIDISFAGLLKFGGHEAFLVGTMLITLLITYYRPQTSHQRYHCTKELWNWLVVSRGSEPCK